MDVELPFLPELERAHRGKGLGDGSQMEGRMGSDGVLVMDGVAIALVTLIEHYAILGYEDTPVETAQQHRIEEMGRRGRVAFHLGPGQRGSRCRSWRHGIYLGNITSRLGLATGYDHQGYGQH